MQARLLQRRAVLLGSSTGLIASSREAYDAVAQQSQNPNVSDSFKKLEDRIEGFSLQYPSDWLKVNTAGSAACYRNPRRPDEIFYVEVSSPKGYQFNSLADLGTEQDAFKRFVDQYQYEFQSTRLGVTREITPIGITKRTDSDGAEFYDLSLSVSSYAAENQLAINPENRPQKLEFSRRALATWSVCNGRLYELRLQVSEKDYEAERDLLESVQRSFKPFVVES